jgi:uncharacterized membrane protein YphA (DoxX/SURF4 family)
MAVRVVTRVALLLAGLGLATVLLVAGMTALSSASANAAGHRDPVAAVERGVARTRTAPAPQGTEPPAVALIFAGILLLAALPPVHRVYVYHRSEWR